MNTQKLRRPSAALPNGAATSSRLAKKFHAAAAFLTLWTVLLAGVLPCAAQNDKNPNPGAPANAGDDADKIIRAATALLSGTTGGGFYKSKYKFTAYTARAKAFVEKGEPQKALDDLNAALKIPDVDPKERAEAQAQACSLQNNFDMRAGKWANVIANSNKALNMPGLDEYNETKIGLLLQRAIARMNQEALLHPAGASDTASKAILADLRQITKFPGSEEKKEALKVVGAVMEKFGLPNNPDMLAKLPDKFFSEDTKTESPRPAASASAGAGDAAESVIHDTTAILNGEIGDGNLGAKEKITLHMARALAFEEKGESQKALADYYDALNIPGIDQAQRAQIQSRVNRLQKSFATNTANWADCMVRAVSSEQKGETQKALADYDAALKIPGIEPDQRAVTQARASNLQNKIDMSAKKWASVIANSDKALNMPGLDEYAEINIMLLLQRATARMLQDASIHSGRATDAEAKAALADLRRITKFPDSQAKKEALETIGSMMEKMGLPNNPDMLAKLPDEFFSEGTNTKSPRTGASATPGDNEKTGSGQGHASIYAWVLIGLVVLFIGWRIIGAARRR